MYADSVDDLFFAQGYVTAQDRLWQMEFQRRVGHSRLSEILGEATLDVDRFLRTIGLSRAAAADLEVIDEETRRILDAYARGVTAFIQTHRDRFPLEFKLLGFQPEPWRPIDSVVWGKVMALDLGGNWETELLRARLIRAFEEEQTSELLPPYREAGPLI
ncbi:MAG: penicillin acylase family protein, partial [Candidatus Bipolaricaulia bacterium]